MYSYTPPRHQTTLALKRPVPTFWVILAVILVGGIVAIRVVAGSVYGLGTKNLPTDEAVVFDAYKAHAATQASAAKAVQIGEKLLDKKLPLYASVNFARASALDPNYRDAAYAWAYALLQAKHDNLSPDDVNDIHSALGRVQKVDPLYKPALEIQLQLAQAEGDKTLTASTQTRLSLLVSPAPALSKN